MEQDLGHAIEHIITSSTGQQAVLRSSMAVGGGCINAARVVVLEDGRRYFVKSNRWYRYDHNTKEAV